MQIIEPNRSYTLTERVSQLSGGNPITYIFDAAQASRESEGAAGSESYYLIMGDFAGNEIVEAAKTLLSVTSRVGILKPSDISVKDFRGLMLFLCGESPVFPCTDGYIGSFFHKKGYTLSMCFPAWNEGETIREVIESFLPVADQIVIGVDEKTNDKTAEIAAEYTSEVHKFKWEKSFCKARNFVLDKCTSDWIFMTEGHEYLHEKSLPFIINLNKDLPPDVTFVKVRRVIDYKKHSEFPWLCRSGKGAHYSNDSHNAIFSDNPNNNLTVAISDIVTVHYRSEGKDKARRDQRRYMNRTNLLRDLIKNPRDSRSMFYLANEYFDYGDKKKAIEYYKQYLSHGKWPEERYQAKLFLGNAQVETGDIAGAQETFLSCFAELVPRNEHMIFIADLIEKENPSAAIFYLSMAAAVPEPSSPMWIDPFFYKQVPLQKLCTIYAELGHLDKALEYANKVKLLYPETPGVESIVAKITEASNLSVISS